MPFKFYLQYFEFPHSWKVLYTNQTAFLSAEDTFILSVPQAAPPRGSAEAQMDLMNW